MSFSFNWQCPLEPLKVEQFSGTDCVLLVLPLETLAFINTNNGENNEERDEIFMRFFLTSPVLQRWCPEMSTASSVSGSSFFSAHCSEFLTWNYGVCCTKDELSTERILIFSPLCQFFCFHSAKRNIFLSCLNWGMDEHVLIFSSRLYNSFNLFCIEIQYVSPWTCAISSWLSEDSRQFFNTPFPSSNLEMNTFSGFWLSSSIKRKYILSVWI